MGKSKKRKEHDYEDSGPLELKKKKKKSLPLHQEFSSEPRFSDRDLSWLDFNRRVLEEAKDPRNPLLERVKFLSIFSSNLDEFVMKNLGKAKSYLDLDYNPKLKEKFNKIHEAILKDTQEQHKIFQDELVPELEKNQIKILSWSDLSETEKTEARSFFENNIFPVLTPLSVDPGHPFPFISNLSTSIAVSLRYPESDEKLFARVKVPQSIPPFFRLRSESSQSQFRFILVRDLIIQFLDRLFPEMVILQTLCFRITRNAEVDLEEDEESDDLLELIEEGIKLRKFADIVRLQHEKNPDPWLLKFIVDILDLGDLDVYEVPGILDYSKLKILSDIHLTQLKFEPWNPLPLHSLSEEDLNIFGVIRKGDLLVHHPYESFSSSIENFVKTAVMDPKVLAIKMTMYRVGDETPFVPWMIQAAESGKTVVCLVELKARFDEERNISWAQKLESAGVHVVYGVVGLKTHSKTTLVVRQEFDGVRCYSHVGTGNYHSQTSKFYTDLGLLTCRPEITHELVEVFNFLTGRSRKKNYQNLLVSPLNMKDELQKLIKKEMENHQKGKPSKMIFKMNGLDHREICDLLYESSKAGVNTDLYVRGLCILKARVQGVSENIRVFSILGRFLEHSRIYYFRDGKDDPLEGKFFIGSADLMFRNLENRVEVMVPILDRSAREKIWEIFQVHEQDDRQVWEMNSQGVYEKRALPPSQKKPNSELGSHKMIMDITKSRLSIKQS